MTMPENEKPDRRRIIRRERRIVPIILKIGGILFGVEITVNALGLVLSRGSILGFAIQVVIAVLIATLFYGAGLLLDLVIEIAGNVKATRVFVELYMDSLVDSGEEDEPEDISEKEPALN